MQEYRFELETGNGFIFQIVDSLMQFWEGGGGGGGGGYAWLASFVRPGVRINFKPLSLNILLKILQTNLNTLKNTVSWGNLMNDQRISTLVIFSLILTTFSIDDVLLLLRENCCWSPLGHKG